MDPSARFEILNDFEKSMRILLRQRNSDRQMFMKDMLIVIKYVSSIKEGVFLSQEIKENFEVFLPKVENEWKNASTFAPLLEATEKYVSDLSRQLQKQQELFENVSVIISSIDMVDSEDKFAIKATMKTTLIPIAVEFKIIKLLCHIHNILFRRDQEKLNTAIEEFLKEFKLLEELSTQPLLQLRGLIEQIKIASKMPSEPSNIKKLLERVIEIAQTFINSFHGEI